MDLFISTAWAQDAAPAAGDGTGSLFIMIGTMMMIWWLIVLRPQTKELRAHSKMVAELRRGDQVITKSGLFGKVTAVEESAVLLEVAKGVKIRFLKDKIARTYLPGGDAAEDSK